MKSWHKINYGGTHLRNKSSGHDKRIFVYCENTITALDILDRVLGRDEKNISLNKSMPQVRPLNEEEIENLEGMIESDSDVSLEDVKEIGYYSHLR